MKSLPLAEPFFLAGRTSILQRAVIMSVVLGSLALLAAWIVVVAYFAARRGIAGITSTQEILVLSAACSAAVPLLVNGPLNFWNRRSVWWTIAAMPMNFAVMWGFFYSLRSITRLLTSLGGLTLSIPVALVICGLLQVRNTRRHQYAWLISVLCGVVPAVINKIFDENAHLQLLLGIAPDLWQVLASVAFGASWFAGQSIPWGIPFWWPPEQSQSELTQPPGQPPTAP